METRTARDRRCTYVVALAHDSLPHGSSPEQRRELAAYLSSLGVAGCEVIILDDAPAEELTANARLFRWVGRHQSGRSLPHNAEGELDLIRAAADLAGCEKVIVAAEDVRYSIEAIDEILEHLEIHEVVEPQDYLDPLTWWGGIEAGRILLHRGIEPRPDHGATLAFHRDTIRGLRLLHVVEAGDDLARRLENAGAEVYAAGGIFVRRQPRELGAWLDQRARAAANDFSLPMKSFFFLSLLPLLGLLAAFADVRLAATYAGIVAFASFALAVRGRIGAGRFFPLVACLFAPLWVVERSISVYWALFERARGARETAAGLPLPERSAGNQVASGE